MKTTYMWLLAVTLSTSLMAQTASNPPANVPISDAAPAPMATTAPMAGAPTAPAKTNAPVAKAAKKKATPAKKKTSKAARPAKSKATSANAPAAPAASKLVNLVPGPAAVTGSNVNVRGQAALRGEVITRLNPGDAVTVLEAVTLEKPNKGEPAQWARIAFPTNSHVWVFADYVDSTNKTVTATKLNLRAGPGENYSVVGTLNRGDIINEILVKENWIELEPPTNAFAFVAAEFLKQEAPAAPATPAAPAGTNLVSTPVAAAQPVAPPPTETTNVTATTTTITPAQPISGVASSNVVATAVSTNEPAPVATTTNEPVPPAPVAVAEEPLPKRIVQREGVVRGTLSIQAPSPLALVNPETGEMMDYLYSPSPQMNLKRYKGLRVMVTGEEGLDRRWKNTPVLTIQRIQVVE